jgi:hypothetical protein
MRERKPFNLYERGGIWHARFWDRALHWLYKRNNNLYDLQCQWQHTEL